MKLRHMLNSFEDCFGKNIQVLISQNVRCKLTVIDADFCCFPSLCCYMRAGFLHWCRPSYQLNSHNVFWVVSMQRSFGIVQHCRLTSFHRATVSSCECFFLRVCATSINKWSSSGNSSSAFSVCKCTHQQQVRPGHSQLFVSECVWDWVLAFLALLCFCKQIYPPEHMCLIISINKGKHDAFCPMLCRSVMGTTPSPPTRRSLHLRLCITWVASMWRSTWWPQQMTLSGTGECNQYLHLTFLIQPMPYSVKLIFNG